MSCNLLEEVKKKKSTMLDPSRNKSKQRSARIRGWGTHHVSLMVSGIPYDKNEIESRKDSCLQINVVLHRLKWEKEREKQITTAIDQLAIKTKSCEAIILGNRKCLIYLHTIRSSYLPEGGLAAASTAVLELRTVVIPALAMEIVCCSIASCMATLPKED